MVFCKLCFQSSRADFCSLCQQELTSVRLHEDKRQWGLPPTGRPILSCYAYRGICRQSIIACKARGFRPLGYALVRQGLSCQQLQETLARCDVIMPAPSSLWSRWRGSLDLAWILAQCLANDSGLLVCPPPLSLSFRWRKQALQDYSRRRGVFRSLQKIYDASYFEPYVRTPLRGAKLRVLLVDDVVTSGSTLNGLAAHFVHVNFEFYTLASAFRLGEDRK